MLEILYFNRIDNKPAAEFAPQSEAKSYYIYMSNQAWNGNKVYFGLTPC
jgi:hypothetical protein